MDIDSELPWGHWLRIERVGGGLGWVDDDTGGAWQSLRGAFWDGRLGLPKTDEPTFAATLELMHGVLAAAARRRPTEGEQSADLFQGNRLFLRSFILWMRREGLVVACGADGESVEPTAEGRSVWLMLSATRPSDVRGHRPSCATVTQIAGLGLGARAEGDPEFVEGIAALWDVAFLRRDEAGRPSIILSRRASGPLPALTTPWTLSFDAAEQRDRFYGWLCARLDRWEAWAELAATFGAAALTNRLLAALASSISSRPGASLRDLEADADHQPGSAIVSSPRAPRRGPAAR